MLAGKTSIFCAVMAGTAATDTKIKAATVFMPVPRTNAAAVTSNSTNTDTTGDINYAATDTKASPVKVNVPSFLGCCTYNNY